MPSLSAYLTLALILRVTLIAYGIWMDSWAHLPYTDVDAVIDQVRATRIHETRQPDVQFVLAVYVKPYPCGVFSVWLYYGTQAPRTY